MADYTIIEEALKRGYTMDEIADNLARDSGINPADARGRGYTTGEMMKNLGYVKPETSDVARGFVTSFKQLPQLGYGLLAGAGAVAESVAGEGGVSTSMKNFGVKKYQEAGADIEKDSKQSDSLSYSWEQAKQGDFGSLVDWLQYGIGYGGGQAVQALATAGVGSLVGKTVLKGTAENLASKMVAKEALRLGATEEAKRLTAQEISKIAVANVASNIGQTVAIGSQAFGMEGGEIFGDLAQKTVKEGRAATGGELAKAFGATAAAGALEFVGDKLGVDVMLGKSKMFKPASSMTGVGGRAARAAVAVPGTVLAEGGTEYLQTGIEEYGKGNEKNFLPFMQSESAQKQALDAAGLGAVGGGGMAMVGGAFSSPQKKDAAPSPSPSISSAQTADDAIAAFQDEVASVTPRGSFGNMDELAGFIEAERSDIGKRRGLLAQQQQDARDMENEFNGLVKDEQIDQSYRLNDAQKQRDAARLREGDYSLAEQQRNEQQGRLPEQAEALSNAQGFGEQEPTAMQLAMQRAQQKALDNEFSGLLKQERANLNEMRANVKRVAGVPVEQISTPQLEEIAQSEAHPNTKMAAVAALNDRHDAIQQERERLMQLRETRLEKQSNQPEQGAQHGAESHGTDGQVATPSVAGGGANVSGGGLDAAMVAADRGMRGTASAGAAVSSGGQVGAVPVADQPANVRALTENAAKRQATQLTNQGYPTVAYPHPTQAGMWAIGSQDEAKAATVPATSATQNDAPPRQSASWVSRNKETGEVVMETFDRKKVDALNTAKYEAVPIREYLEGLNNRNESTAAEPPAVEVRAPVQRKRPASNNIAQAIINLGGISTSLKTDILGDASIKTRPGLFTTNGTGDLGEIAAMLSNEFRFSQIDLNDPTDNSGAKQLADLIASSVNGETILNEEAMLRAQQDEEFEQAKAEVNLQAQEIGIKPIRGKRTIDIVQSEINAILAEREEMSRQKKKAQLLLDEVAEQELIEAFDLAMQEYHDETAISRDESRVESARISTEESAQGDGDSVDQASPVAGRASPTEGGRGEAEVTPEFGLVGQTEEEAIAEEQARRDEDQRKADEDRAEDRRIAAEETARRNVQNVNTVASDNFQLGQSRQEVRRMVHSGMVDMFGAGHENANSGEAKDGNTQDSASTEQGGASNSHGERIHPRSDLPDGTRIVDGNGNPYRVHYQRNSLVVAHPIIDGKPVVSADTSVRFWVDPNREASGENDRLDPIYRDTSTSQEQPAVKQNPAEQPKSDSELQQIGSPQWALDMRNRGEVPEGWYVHGRKGRQDLNTNNVIQMTRDWDVADQYAKKDGSQWLIRPAKDATVLDLSSKSSKDMDRVVERAIRDFENGDLDFIEWIEASIGRDATAGDVENAVRESFAPGDIVNSAEAYDNWEFAGWLVDRFGVDFVETPDGAVAMDGDTGIEKVKVPNEGDQVTSTSKQKPADQQADAIEPVQPETPIEPITRRQEMQARGQEARIQDFGAKIGGARKDTAQPIGKRGTVAKDEDSRPAWERKYVAMQDVRTGKWGLNKIVSGSKGATTRVTGAKFDTEAEAIKAIPLADVSRNHRVYSYDEQQGDSQVLKWGIYRNITDRKRALVKGGFDSYEDAMKDMASNPVQIIEHKFEFPERPWLDRIERTGPSVRTGDVTTTMFQDTFGFRGGEFGNWNMGGDGQEALNHAYDALHDLANAIGVAPKALSLNGQLAIAFGARGKGGKNSAAAHYEPGAVVINLTKIKGAGSAAHEWWHALDDYFASESSNSAVSDGFGYKSKARPELVESFKNVVDTIMNSERSRTTDADVIRANAQKRLDAALGDLDYRLNDLRQPYAPKRAFTAEELKQFDALVKKLRNGELGEQVYVASQSKMKGAIGYSVGANIRDLNAIYKQATGRSFLKSDPSSIGRQMQWTVSAISDNKAKLETKESVTSTIKGRSEFYLEARKIDGYRASDYWSMPEEMGARAFESYIFDKLTGTGNRSDYLVYAVENRHYAALGMKPYPEGGERQAINSAFDKLFETVQTKETDSGVAMFNKKVDNASHEATTDNGIPAGLPGRQTEHSKRLEHIIDNELQRTGQPTGFKALAIGSNSLPDPLRRTLAGFERVTGTQVVIFRNLTPEITDFDGVTVRDGVLFISETSANPAIGVAAHEWVHNLRKSHPDLYQQLVDEVARQGDTDGFAKKFGYAQVHGQEELTAAAVGDAMADTAFLQRLANRDQGLFSRVAKEFMAFLKTLTAKWKDQGSSAYLKDVEAFRDLLLDVMSKNGETSVSQEFAETERAYGGREAYDRAKADGKTKLGYRQWVQVRTDSFKKWFGDWENDPANASKIVDPETGEPLVVYHGTSSDITEFTPEGGGSRGDAGRALEIFRKARAENTPFGYMNFRAGSFFSPNPDYSGHYAPDEGGHIYAAFIKAENLVYQDQSSGKVTVATRGKTSDALVMRDGETINEIAVIDPTQIKSATGNTGAFDGANPDIRYSRNSVDTAEGKYPGFIIPESLRNTVLNGVPLFSRSQDNVRNKTGGNNDGRAFQSGIPQGLRAGRSDASDALNDGINRELQRSGEPGGFLATEVAQAELPDALRRALGAFRDATGVTPVIFRNLTPKVADFQGVAFRDGSVYINEDSQSPVITTAAHEWLHDLRKTNHAMYRQLVSEVRRQGRLAEYQQKLRRDGETRWQNQDVVEEELTAAAVGDALTAPAFLQRLAERNSGLFRRMARAFVDFLNTLTEKWRDQGSNVYLKDVEAFRDTLADVLAQYEQASSAQQNPSGAKAMPEQETLDSLNPTGSVFSDYSPERIAALPLGENITTLDKTSGESPDTVITIYRGTTSNQGEIVPGDFVTTSRQLAKDYAGTGKVISKQVRMADVLDDITEPLGEEYIYRPASRNEGKAKFSRKNGGGNNSLGLAGGENTPAWDVPPPSRTDNIIYTMQDKNIDLKRVQQAIKEAVGEIRDDIDTYLQEELFHGRAAKITEEFLGKEVNPLISLMRASNVSMDELETFLWARHAKERNAQIAKINDEMPDGGSGLTNKQADDLMGGKDVTIGDKTIAGVKPARKKLLSDLAGRVDVITKGSRALLERYGLESAETLNAWDGAYQHYVPLHREDTDSHLAGMGTGQGYSVKGSSSKRATGSFRPVENILANLVLQRERIITRGEKNRVAQALHGLAKEMPNADLWEVDVKPTIRTTAMIGGREQVVDAVDPNFRNKPNVVFARFNGEDRFVVFNEHNERALRMAEALKNLDADDISHLLGEVSRWTRYFASINTQYNPIFGVTNLVRDVQTGLLNLKSTQLDGKQKEMAGNLVHALPAVFKALRADRKGQAATGTWAQLWEEFQEVGGQTGYRDMFRNSHERAEALQNALDPTWWQKTWWGKAATVGGIFAAPEQVFVEKVGKPFMELLSDYNTMMENGIRLSAYKLALDSGMTKERAASLAKNLTVNFNRKGQAGRQVGAMYAFFNASVQGTARMAETLNHGAKPGELLGKAGKQIIYGGLMLGALQAMLLLAAGFDDEEPPEFVRDRNIIIPTGNGKYISIPLPLGFHVLPAISRISIEFTAGGFKKPGEHLVHIMDVLLDSFNPIGNAGLSMQTVAPTVLDPIAALTENKDWSGRQIARQDFSKLNPTPGHTRAKDTASSLSRGLAYALNYLSGGGEYGIGVVSPTPDQIDYLLGQLTGGVGRELGKVLTTAEVLTTGEDLPPHKIPLVGRFYGDTTGQSSEASKFYGTLEKLSEHKGALDRMKDAHDVESYREYAKEHPEIRLYARAARVQREMASLRKLKRKMIERNADRAKVRQIEDRMRTLMTRFNQSVSEQKGDH